MHIDFLFAISFTGPLPYVLNVLFYFKPIKTPRCIQTKINKSKLARVISKCKIVFMFLPLIVKFCRYYL